MGSKYCINDDVGLLLSYDNGMKKKNADFTFEKHDFYFALCKYTFRFFYITHRNGDFGSLFSSPNDLN